MPALAITDYVLTGAGRAGVFVQLRDNASGAVFTSSVATDSNGQFSIVGSPPPPADYAAYISLSLLAPTWTLWDPHFRVAYTKGDDLIVSSVTAAGPVPWIDPSHPNFNCKFDGVTDDTTGWRAVITYLNTLTKGARVLCPPGMSIVDVTYTVGSAGDGSLCGAVLPLPTKTWLDGAGDGVSTIQFLGNPNRAATATQQNFVINSHPELATDTAIYITNLTFDCNRQNQGPYAYQVSSAAAGGVSIFSLRGIAFWKGSGMAVDNVSVINCNQHALFVEAGATNIDFGRVFCQNCVAGPSFDSAYNSAISRAICVNSDVAGPVNTTSTTAVPGGANATVTPASMVGITPGTVLMMQMGNAVQVEQAVLVLSVTATTFTGYFASAKSGTWTIKSAAFMSDGAVQIHIGCARIACDSVIVDHTNALAPIGAALEISGAKSISVGVVVGRGVWRTAWIHNLTVLGTDFIVEDVGIAALAAVNNVNSATAGLGAVSNGIIFDDWALVGTTKTLRNVAVGACVIRYGQGGAAIPQNSIGINFTPNTAGCSIGVADIDGASQGMTWRGGFNNALGAVAIRNTQAQGLLISSAATGYAIASLVIFNTGLGGGGAGNVDAIRFADATACVDNVFAGINIKGVPAGGFAVNMLGATGSINNLFMGNVNGNPVPAVSPIAGNIYQLIGYSPYSIANSLGAYAGAIAKIQAAGVDQFVVDTALGVLAYGPTTTAVLAAANARLGVIGGNPALVLDRGAGTAWVVENVGDVLTFLSAGFAFAWYMDKAGHFSNGNTNPPTSSALNANITSVVPAGSDVAGALTIVVGAGGLAANTKICHIAHSISWATSVTPHPALINQTAAAGLAVVTFYSTGDANSGYDLFADQALVPGTYIVKYLVF